MGRASTPHSAPRGKNPFEFITHQHVAPRNTLQRNQSCARVSVESGLRGANVPCVGGHAGDLRRATSTRVDPTTYANNRQTKPVTAVATACSPHARGLKNGSSAKTRHRPSGWDMMIWCLGVGIGNAHKLGTRAVAPGLTLEDGSRFLFRCDSFENYS